MCRSIHSQITLTASDSLSWRQSMPIERMNSRRDTSTMHTLPAASVEAARLWGRSTNASLSATVEVIADSELAVMLTTPGRNGLSSNPS